MNFQMSLKTLNHDFLPGSVSARGVNFEQHPPKEWQLHPLLHRLIETLITVSLELELK